MLQTESRFGAQLRRYLLALLITTSHITKNYGSEPIIMLIYNEQESLPQTFTDPQKN